MYNASLNLGVATGAIVDGFIVKYHPWRYIYYVAIALIGGVTIIVWFTFPETAYNRSPDTHGITTTLHAESEAYHRKLPDEEGNVQHIEVQPRAQPKTSELLMQGLKLYHGTFTEESLWSMTIRPVALLALPPVLWATLVMSVTIGFITAITSNVSPAFETAYGFEAWQSGLCFFAGVIGALIGIFCGGHLSDWVADYFTRRNNGIREPEMRLPAIMISCITGPLALILYGVGIQNKLHWMVPTLGIGLSKSSTKLPHALSTDFDPSQLLHHPSHQRLPRLHNRLLPPHRRRDRRDPAGLQVGLWLPPRLLHQPLGRRGRVRRRLRRDGCYLWWRAHLLDPHVHLGPEDSRDDYWLEDDEVCALGY